jgi:tetratricopeptide (TPR) repeat protein
VAGAVALVIGLGGGGGASNSGSGSTKHSTTRHKSKTKTTAQTTPAATPAPAQTQQQTTPPATTDPVALNNQGKSLIDSGNPQAAIPVLQRALAAFPAAQRSDINYAYTLFNLGDAYLKTGQPDKAIPLLQARLGWNDQRDVVAAELRDAMQQAGQSPQGKDGHGKKKGHDKGH